MREIFAKPEDRYNFDPDKLAVKVIESEVIMIDLQSGTYFSLEGSASLAWQCLSSGYSLQRTKEQLVAYYEMPDSQVQTDLERFVAGLLKEGVLSVQTSNETPASARKELCLPEERKYRAPDMIVLREMKDLMDMRLEPIAPIVK